MNGLLTHSNLSFGSFEFAPRSPSVTSFMTDTSSNTMHPQGIGTLSARMIYAFGAVALRGIENLAIRRRLGQVVATFPLEDDDETEGLDTIYDHTLEFSRFGLYRASIRKQALQVLLGQIANRQTRHLIRCLLKWPLVEIALFVSEILSCMPVNWLPPHTESTDMHRELMDAYLSAQRSRTGHPFSALVDFVVAVADVNQMTCRAVLHSGFLDILLCMYACNFICKVPGVDDVEYDRKTILDAVYAALSTLVCQPYAQTVISTHPICVLWTQVESLLTSSGEPKPIRQAIWRKLGLSIVSRRLSSLAMILQSPTGHHRLRLAELEDARDDLVEFSRDDIYGPEIAQKALTLTHRYSNTNEVPRQLSVILSSETSSAPTSAPQTHSSSDGLVTSGVRSRFHQKFLLINASLPYSAPVDENHKTWEHGQDEILIDSDGRVKGGTIPALVEHLTSDDRVDPVFQWAFLMTYKSFMTLDELFDLLVLRCLSQPLEKKEPDDRKTSQKCGTQMRVMETLMSMIRIEGVIEHHERYILDHIREFVTKDEVYNFSAAKEVLALIERSKNGDVVSMMNAMPLTSPPAPIEPNAQSKLNLIDIDTLELARQLTIMESMIYRRIKPIECFRRSRNSTVDYEDDITAFNQHANRVALWVQHSVLSKHLRTRAALIKRFITVAVKCRRLQNYSSMVAIIVGLNAAPIRRLKRSWELVGAGYLAQLNVCEAIIDPHRNFQNYRQTLATISPPCVPYIGVFLRTHSFIQEGSPDFLDNGIINFRKREMTAEVINDIKRWQCKPHHFHPLPLVLAFLKRSLLKVSDCDSLWALSLEREPQESPGDKRIRLSLESGLL